MLSDGMFITTSVDQRVSIWRLTKEHDQEGLSLSRKTNYVHDVADAADMLTYQTK